MAKQEIRIWLNKEHVSKEGVAEALKDAQESAGDVDDEYLYAGQGVTVIDGFDNGAISVNAQLDSGAYVSFDVELNDDYLVRIIEYAVKKMNKIKTVVEGLK